VQPLVDLFMLRTLMAAFLVAFGAAIWGLVLLLTPIQTTH
jgi:hypothetical protein